MASTPQPAAAPTGLVRSRNYQIYILTFMGVVALMDQYLTTVESTAIPYLLAEYQIEAADFASLKARFLIITFFVFALNALNDLFGRKPAILVLILLMGLSSLAIVFFTPTLTLFMVFYALAMFATVSNMWSIAVGEESPADRRARYTAIVFAVGLLPVQAYLPVFVVQRLGLNWRWMYGVAFVIMIPALALWLFTKETGRYRQIEAERRQKPGWRDLTGLGKLERADLRYVVLAAAVAIGVLVAITMAFWAGYFFMKLRSYTVAQWSSVFFGILTMQIIGSLSGGWLMDRVGRNRLFIIGGVGMGLMLASFGFLPRPLLPFVCAATGFPIGIVSAWIVVYIPEIFPTGRRGVCVGWVMSLARLSYVFGPALAALLLRRFPTMEGFWVAAGLVMLVPIAIVFFVRPFETRGLELEAIAARR